jgi:hypothetical protein
LEIWRTRERSADSGCTSDGIPGGRLKFHKVAAEIFFQEQVTRPVVRNLFQVLRVNSTGSSVETLQLEQGWLSRISRGYDATSISPRFDRAGAEFFVKNEQEIRCWDRPDVDAGIFYRFEELKPNTGWAQIG